MQQSRSYSRGQVAFQPEDDVDELFNRLEQLEPPGELVARILTHIGRLSRSSMHTPLLPERTGSEESQGLIVRNEWRDPA